MTPVPIEQLRPHLHAFDFPTLFVEGLGWDHYRSAPLSVRVNERDYTLSPIAEKADFAVYECAPGANDDIPPYPVRRKIESEVAKRAFEHLIIFTDSGRGTQVWQWVKRETGKPAACREYAYTAGSSGDPILQRLQTIAFTLEDEAKGIGISDVVTPRVRKAFDVEKVTRRFYERFRTELTAFGNFIEGIAAQGDREWYASLMLNRMMFVYFVQKQGFLDNDADYLRNRLKMVQSLPGRPEPTPGHPEPVEGPARFQQFYRLFLLRLFHEGLGQPEAQRAPDLAALLGKVPFLNGGLFDVHDLERHNPRIAIPDAAFERVFDFFDRYRWHLDERPSREDNEINPDVLGYIFEKYVNQKQMGAYYTKEDITGYISRNTVIPFLFDAARKECRTAFGPGGGVWRLLQDDPDRYVYPAVAHGITRNAQDPIPLNPSAPSPVVEEGLDSSPSPSMGEGWGEGDHAPGAPLHLPDHIAAGIHDVSQRGGWNAPAPDRYALPTETWREVVARRQRHEEVRARLAAGDVREINDLITLNLDVEQFARDVIAQSEGPELLRAFWHALRDVSVLDPTCGSGAFLFAALNVLEPLYTACLEGMRGFLDDAERSERKRSPEHLGDFRRILGQVDEHPSERYFILKSIVLNNLYGVDIMEEAVEICKLRLFLKLVAQLETYEQIEPLPDIDFNIRTGNTLVGFTSLDAVQEAMRVTPDGQRRQVFPEDQAVLDRIEEEARGVDWMAHEFRRQQTMLGGEVTSADKQDLRDRLRTLADKLDRHLAAEYGIGPDGVTEHNLDSPDCPACAKRPDMCPKCKKDPAKCDKDPARHDAYQCWRTSHQPFHWLVEFYGIMFKGGFDVVIGNPPYVEYSKVKTEYTVRTYETASCGNLYAYVLERSKALANRNASLSMIVPLSGHSTQRMQPLVQNFYKHYSSCHLFNISADAHPSVLFNGVKFRLAIFVASNRGNGIFTTGYHRWYAEQRDSLFDLVEYTDTEGLHYETAVPKISGKIHLQVLKKMLDTKARIDSTLTFGTSQDEVLYHSTPVNWIRAHTTAPFFQSERDGVKVPNGLNPLRLNRESAGSIQSILSSTSFFIWWLSLSDCYHLNRPEVLAFPLCKDAQFDELSKKLQMDMQAKSKRRVYNYKTSGRVEYDEFYLKLSKPIIDEIDRVLAKHYGFTDEELDFIINYDIKYRMGRDG